jgi:hypothetical protein
MTRINFLPENMHLSIHTGRSTFTVASRSLARSMLFVHLLKLPVSIHAFKGLEDPSWLEYKVTKKVKRFVDMTINEMLILLFYSLCSS